MLVFELVACIDRLVLPELPVETSARRVGHTVVVQNLGAAIWLIALSERAVDIVAARRQSLVVRGQRQGVGGMRADDERTRVCPCRAAVIRIVEVGNISGVAGIDRGEGRAVLILLERLRR